ncbi:hypothetical protein OIO90_001912 [Microbotryomycetes sp. JL221]|nr:hypothetical protein OIO90_001912 [Microbotryomycetes sp. JL221]
MWPGSNAATQAAQTNSARPADFVGQSVQQDLFYGTHGLGNTSLLVTEPQEDVKPTMLDTSSDQRDSSTGPAKRNKQPKPGADSSKPALARGLACTVCRKRKLRCDGQRPECGTCVRLGHSCVYGDPIHEKLHERIKDLESKMATLQLELDEYRAGDKNPAQAQHDPVMQSLPRVNPPPDSGLQPIADGSPLGLSTFAGSAPGTASTSIAGSALPSVANDTKPHQAAPTGQTYETSSLHSTFPQVTAPGAYMGFTGSPIASGSSPASVQAALGTPYHSADLQLGGAPVSVPLSVADQAYFPTTTHSPAGGYTHEGSSVFPRMLNGSAWQENTGVTTTWGAELPSYPVLLELASLYFETVHQHFPFLHRSRFLYSLNNPSSLVSPPSLSLIFAVLAIAAPYHDTPEFRSNAPQFYAQARDKVELALNVGVQGRRGRTVATLTVEIVQALCLLTMIEMSNSDHQRAHLTIGQAVRVAVMLGLHRMDEDKIEQLQGSQGPTQRRLRPPALHALPTDPVLVEECRRTMCTVFCLDRFESGCIGWPAAISELDIRLLLPCNDHLYENGLCTATDNSLWWPATITIQAQDRNGEQNVSAFGWLIRCLWLAGRIQEETYRSAGRPAAGPWSGFDVAPVDDAGRIVSMDQALDFLRAKVTHNASINMTRTRLVDGPLVMALLVIHCSYINLHHLRVGVGMSRVPFDPHAQIIVGSAEYSMSRCIDAIKALVDIMTQLTVYENSRTSLYGSRVNTFTAFVPYTCYAIVFPARFTTGDWAVIVNSRLREENVTARVSASSVPSGDDVFGPSMDDYRLGALDTFYEALDRIGTVWPIGKKFAALVKADKTKLASVISSRNATTRSSLSPAQTHRQQQLQPQSQSARSY